MKLSGDNYLQVEEIAWKKGSYDIEVCGIFNKAKRERRYAVERRLDHIL